jgi:acyl transferase domain-containing protein/SAM-dependent methyltransferase/acyl carrier protein
MSSEATSNEFLERIQKLSPKRLALLAAELERRLAAREAAAPAPIAVIGIGCRMPGGITNPDEFWNLLVNKADAIEEIPASRWDANTFYDAQPGTPGKMNTKWGGFVGEIDQFDAAFFGISPREAVGLDPQQRMLLEVSWEALENACIRPDSLNGSPTGVFVGMSTNDYASLLSAYDDDLFDAYSGTGIARSVAAGRLSYFLGLKGPNLAIDTACSSSAVAIHMACQSLRQNECRLALAGGVNAILVPQLTVTLSQARMLSSDGRCKTFSKQADGFVRSEGCGMIALKRLADAESDGDTILGVIRGSAINHDGRSSGLTAPNGPSQEAVVSTALAIAGITVEDIDYIEAHGTGTVLGDAIELGALSSVFGTRRIDEPLHIGSVKTNIGHTEAAAGVAGVIKVLLALTRGTIPAHLHFKQEQKNDALDGTELRIPVDALSWPSSEGRRRIAGVSSFGFSGTNAHLVIQEAPLNSVEPTVVGTEVLTVSARTPNALVELCLRYAHYLREHGETSLADFVFSLNTGRSPFQHRIAILAGSIEDAASQLEQIVSSDIEKHPAYRFVTGFKDPAIGFLFTGQGSQYPAMGRSLYRLSAAFRAAVDRCDKILSDKLNHSLAALLRGDEDISVDLIHETAWTQPVLFAFEYALAMMWRSWGVRPAVVLGHSLGEYVAACIAGVYSLEDALTLAYERGRLMGSLPRGGAMLAARISEPEITEMLQKFPDLSLAAVNGALSVVVSGNSAQIEQLRTLLATKGLNSQQLTVSHAFHSQLMDPILDAFERLAANLKVKEPEIALISNVSGGVYSSSTVIDAAYWRKHLRSTVRFADGITSMLKQMPAILVEIGPDPVLLGMARPALAQTAIPSVASLQRTKDAWQTLSEALRQLYLVGAPINWAEVYRARSAHKLALPTYPFQRQRYWVNIPDKASTAVPVETSRHAIEVSHPFDSMLYVTEWKSQPIADVSSRVPAHLLEVVIRDIQTAASDKSSREFLQSFERFLPELDLLCALYVVETLALLGLEMRQGEKIFCKDILSAMRVNPEHQRLVQRMFNILEEDKIVRRIDDYWIVDQVPATKAAETHARLSRDFSQFSAELNFVKQAQHLKSVVRGEMSAVEALFPEGSFDLAEKVYRDAPAARIFNHAVAEVVKSVVDSYPRGHQVKIVEIGAGTGSTSAHVLPQLAGKNVDYLFTDISSAFSAKARTKFAALPFVRYGVLDIERGSSDDTFMQQPADIVIAANVLHATANLAQTIENIKLILRPGGTLILLEGTKPQRFGDLTVGMTDGWWRFNDAAFRENYPLIKRQSWLQLLSNAGFECTALPEEGPASIITSQQAIVIAQKASPARQTSSQHTEKNAEVLLFAADDKLAVSLRSIGIRMRLATTPFDAEAFGHIFDTGQPAPYILYELPLAKEDMPAAAMENAKAALDLIQCLLKINVQATEIWFLSREAGDHSGPSQNVASKVVDGLARSARLEHPEIIIRRIDLPTEPTDEDLHALATLMRDGTNEHDIEIYGGRVRTLRFVPLAAMTTRNQLQIDLSREGAYLITGAFGGLGIRTVQWLSERGAQIIYLVGRHAPSQSIQDQLASVIQSGVKLHYVVADVANRDKVTDLLQKISVGGSPLRGVIHAAGVVDDAVLLQQTPANLAKVFAAKVSGSWNLHEATKGLPLDFFVMYGSAASSLGSAGQSNHSAANAFLDALATLRKSMGLPALTIAWGAWSEIGAATRVKDTGRSVRIGLKSLTPEKGIELLEQSMLSGRANIIAIAVDWSAYLAPSQTTSTWPLFEEICVPSSGGVSNHAESLSLKDQLQDASVQERLAVIKSFVRARISDVLRLDTGSVFLDDQPLAELGLDSLMALELKNELQVAAGITLPPNFFFDYPTLNMAVTCLDARLVVSKNTVDSSEFEELSI